MKIEIEEPVKKCEHEWILIGECIRKVYLDGRGWDEANYKCNKCDNTKETKIRVC